MRLDPELVDGAPAAGARVVTLARLADAEEAAARLADPADREALHDLRVALRRLRSTLRALAPFLGEPLPERPLRRLRKASRRTGPARDLEVFQGWLAEVRPRLQPAWRGAHDWLGERVERRRAQALGLVHEEAVPRVLRAAAALARHLTAPPPGPAANGPATLGAALATLLRGQAVHLREAVRAVVGPEDVTGLHQVRIEGKRLRYLLEPLRGTEGADAGEAVRSLKALQDALGEWHDAQQARRLLAASLTEAAADRVRWRGRGGGDADLRPGLLALDLLATEKAAAGWERLRAGWLDDKARPLLDEVYALVAALEARQGAGPAEEGPERRLLLTALPPQATGGETEEVEEGWLPGDRQRESVGVVRAATGEQHFRSRAAGRGPGQVTAISRADFEALWPLTEGRRVARRCHRPTGEPGWRFDEYLDRALVMAVAEGEAEAEGPPPDWLEPLVVRDVTGERGYADEALARRAPRKPPEAAPAGPPA